MADGRLTGNAPVEVDGIVIDAPGLVGEVAVDRGGGLTRGGDPRKGTTDAVPDAIREAMRRQSMRPRKTIRIEAPTEAAPPTRGIRRGAAAPPTTRAAGRPEKIRLASPEAAEEPRPGRPLARRARHHDLALSEGPEPRRPLHAGR